MTYDHALHLRQITDWYEQVLQQHYPAGPDRGAKELILATHRRVTADAIADPTPVTQAAAVQWARAVLILADAEHDAGRPGWRDEWTDVYEYYVTSNILGPYAPADS
ncbi:hypothetical protein ABZX40_13380 [Streptomyces sp. NPDC004610]|uniref:hypothetical protein n=1 Tax=unclassified Streptomyces TaxID=2593676 RepID=UPI0033BA8D96